MKKIHYITPEIDVLDMELQSFIAGSGQNNSVTVEGTEIGEGDVGADEGGLFGTLE